MYNSTTKAIVVDNLNQSELVVKSNNLIEASYRLTTQEQKVVLLVSSMIKPDDEDFREYYIDVKLFMDLIGVKGHSKYKELKSVTKKLKGRILVIKDLEDETETQVGWVSSFKYFDKKGYVRIRFDPELKPYFLNLQKRFTQYQRKYVLRLKSFYSIRIYELLKQYEKIKERYFDLSELRKILGIKPTEYNLYGNLKNKVLKRAERELPEKTDLKFTFKEKKEGRKVVGIYFFIKANVKKTDNEIIEIENLNLDLYLRLQEYFCLTPSQARQAMEMKAEKELLENLAYVEMKQKQGEIKKNIGGYAWQIIKENIKLQNSLFELEEEKKNNEKKQKMEQKKKVESIQDFQKEYRIFSVNLAVDAFKKLSNTKQQEYIKRFKQEVLESLVDDNYNYSRINNAIKSEKKRLNNYEFKRFLGDSEIIEKISFIEWVKTHHGVDLVELGGGGYEIFG